MSAENKLAGVTAKLNFANPADVMFKSLQENGRVDK